MTDTKTLEQRKADLLSQINGMTHNQLVRYAKFLGISLGDYMKLGKADIQGKLTGRFDQILSLHGEEDMDALEVIHTWEGKIAEAFPNGIYHRGERNQGFGASKKAVEASQSQAVSVAAGDTEQALQALKTLLGAGQATINPEQVRAIVQKELEGLVLPVTVQLRTEQGEVRKLDGVHHRRFPDLLAKVQSGVNVWLAGPAGTGKTTAAQNVAKALSLPFHFNGAIDNEYKLLGFTDAQGRVVSRPFREAFINGGVYLFDEVDASLAGALLAFNAALANGHCDFPDGCFERHKDFRVIAAANTFGHGANADYVGRARQDGAFLDRFVTQPWEIDETLERVLAGNDKWVTYVQDVRKRVEAKGLKVIISPRASIHGAKMLAAGIHWDECAASCIRKGMSDEQWTGVKG